MFHWRCVPGLHQGLGETLVRCDLAPDVVVVGAGSLDDETSPIGGDIENNGVDQIPTHVGQKANTRKPSVDVCCLVLTESPSMPCLHSTTVSVRRRRE